MDENYINREIYQHPHLNFCHVIFKLINEMTFFIDPYYKNVLSLRSILPSSHNATIRSSRYFYDNIC